MRPKLTDEQLIELFYQRGTAKQLADQQGVDPREITRGWQRVKSKGGLPKERPLELYQRGLEDDEEHESGERPRESGSDALLALLIKHHGQSGTV